MTATHRFAAILLSMAVVLGACTAPSSAVGTNGAWQPGQVFPYPIVADPGFRGEFADPFIGDVAGRTWKYLSSDWARSNHLPWSWRSEQLQGGDYANTAEIGLLALSWLAAYDLGQPWGPTWEATEAEIMAILTQLRNWQTGVQIEQPHGSNAYSNSVFYHNTFASLWLSDKSLSRVNCAHAGNIVKDGSNNIRIGWFGKQFNGCVDISTTTEERFQIQNTSVGM